MCLYFALVFCVLLFNCTSHLYMLYSAVHTEYMSTAVLTVCIYSSVMLPCKQKVCCTRGTQYCSPE